MSREFETREAVKQAIDLIDKTSEDLNVKRGSIAVLLLRRRGASSVTKRASLIVRTQELIKQNPPRGVRFIQNHRLTSKNL